MEREAWKSDNTGMDKGIVCSWHYEWQKSSQFGSLSIQTAWWFTLMKQHSCTSWSSLYINISTNNIISVEAAKVLQYARAMEPPVVLSSCFYHLFHLWSSSTFLSYVQSYFGNWVECETKTKIWYWVFATLEIVPLLPAVKYWCGVVNFAVARDYLTHFRKLVWIQITPS
jgi:hypothetical protein